MGASGGTLTTMFDSPTDWSVSYERNTRNLEALPGVLGIQGEGSFIIRELGSTCKYFKGSGEQAGI